MDIKGTVEGRVHKYYVEECLNCEQTTLRLLSELFGAEADPNEKIITPIPDGCCGLIRGGLRFLQALGRGREDMEGICSLYVEEFRERFNEVLCMKLRGCIKPNDPPRVCEGLVREAMMLDLDFIKQNLQREVSASGLRETAYIP